MEIQGCTKCWDMSSIKWELAEFPCKFVAHHGFVWLPFDSGMNLLCLCPTAAGRTVFLQLGNASIFCSVQWSGAGGGNGVWVGRGAFYVIRQLLYFSDKCVFLLAKVSYLLLTTCKVVVFSRAGQSCSVVEDTNDLISAECSCHTMFLLCNHEDLACTLPEKSVLWAGAVSS